MIYRILVDNREHFSQISSDYIVTANTLRLLASDSDSDIFGHLLQLKHKGFPDIERFAEALANILGDKIFSRFKRETLIRAWQTLSDDRPAAAPWEDEEERTMGGAGYGWLADVMEDRGLTAPDTKNPRLRYYFIELGWRAIGRHVVAEARRLGHLVKVIRQKNPRESQIAFRDKFQIAILQKRKPSKRTKL
jgi:hypothetical protein